MVSPDENDAIGMFYLFIIYFLNEMEWNEIMANCNGIVKIKIKNKKFQ